VIRCLVTGATGLIGSYIVQVLKAAGYDVRALVRPGRPRRTLDLPALECLEGDVLVDDARLHSACEGCDTVFHAAAYFAYAGFAPGHLKELAVAGTENVLRAAAAAGVRRVIVTSSSVVFGYSDTGAVLLDETAALSSDRRPEYVAAKIAQHERAIALASALGLEMVLACPTITLGAVARELGPSNGLLVAYLSDPFHCTFPGGCNIASARDVAHGHLLLAQQGVANESYLLGSENMSWRVFHEYVSELAGVARPAVQLNHTLAFLAASAEEAAAHLRGRTPLFTRDQAAMLGRYYWYSHAKAAKLGYAPRPACAALVEAISWLAGSAHISREARAGMRLSDEVYRYRARQQRTGQ
jgi:dihydroflavonol-4-reductase